MSVAPAYIYNVKFKSMFSLQTTEFDYTYPESAMTLKTKFS